MKNWRGWHGQGRWGCPIATLVALLKIYSMELLLLEAIRFTGWPLLKLHNIMLYGIIFLEVMPVVGLFKKAAENQRFRIIAYLSGGAITVILLCILVISVLNGGERITENIVVAAYAEDEIQNAEESGVFCKSILSTKIDSDITDGKTIVLTSSREYQNYLNKYDDISVVEPEQVPLVEDWFSAGYYAIIVSTDQYELPVNLTATAKYADADGNVKILVGPSDINPKFVYNQDLDSCKQASVVIFLDQELITDAPSITIMFMQ